MSSPFHLGRPRGDEPGCGWLRLEEYVRVGPVHHEAASQYERCLALHISVVGVFVGGLIRRPKIPCSVWGAASKEALRPVIERLATTRSSSRIKTVSFFTSLAATKRKGEPITIIEIPVVTVDDLTAGALEREARPLTAVRNVNLIDEGMPSEQGQDHAAQP